MGGLTIPKLALITAVVVALLATGCGGAARHKPAVAPSPPLPWWTTAPRVEFGYIKSLTPLGAGYKLRLDLHLKFGPDKTGLQACIDNRDCPAGTENFLDDTYERDLEYVVTYYVPPETPVSLVGFGTSSPTVSARYVYRLAQGHNPRHLRIMAVAHDVLKEFAFYVQVGRSGGPHDGFEAVTRIGQVYHP